MTAKAKTIGVWVLTGAVSLIFLFTAFAKIAIPTIANEMAEGLGISLSALRVLAFIELLSVLLFLIPRTAFVGYILLVAYMGGAISAHLITGESLAFPIVIQVLLCIIASLRIPELKGILKGIVARNEKSV